MLNCGSIFINIEAKRREILFSPICLQSPKTPEIKSGRIKKLYLYEGWRDEAYLTNLEKEQLSASFKTEGYLINYGQDFGKFYLGCLLTESEDRNLWQWTGDSVKISNAGVNILKSSIFREDEDIESRNITIFTPTRPSDFNIGTVYYP